MPKEEPGSTSRTPEPIFWLELKLSYIDEGSQTEVPLGSYGAKGWEPFVIRERGDCLIMEPAELASYIKGDGDVLSPYESKQELEELIVGTRERCFALASAALDDKARNAASLR